MVDPVSLTLEAGAAEAVVGGAAAGSGAAGGIGMGSMAASAGGAILGALGSIFTGQSQSSMYKYQAGVAQINKQIELQNADYARKVGETQAQESGMRTAFQRGTTLATQGASGLDVNRGSAPLVRESETDLGRFDQAVIRSNAAKRAYGFEVSAMKEGVQANIYGAAAKTSMTSGYIGAGTSLLSGAGSVSSKWLQGNQIGLWGGGNPTAMSGTSYGDAG